MNAPIFETEHLAFRPFTPVDYDLLAELHAAPEVQRYIGGPWPRAAIQERLDYYVAEQARFGFSKWKTYRRDGTFIGRVGISWWDKIGEFELGYSLKRAAWGQGFATEASAALVRRFFETTPHPRLHAFTDVENQPSRHVLARIGMTFIGDQDLGFGGFAPCTSWSARPRRTRRAWTVSIGPKTKPGLRLSPPFSRAGREQEDDRRVRYQSRATSGDCVGGDARLRSARTKAEAVSGRETGSRA